MDVAIAGGHGQIARLLTPLLAGRGDRVRALIRNPGHADAVRALGAEPVLLDLETAGDAEVAAAVAGADAVVFAAGAGPGSGPERKLTLDRDGAVKLMGTGVPRYVMVSAMGAVDPPGGDDTFSVYLRAKADADAALRDAGLHHTIVRPGRLTDDPATGRVAIAPSLPRGAISRADVAAVLAAVLADARTAGTEFDLVAGDDPIAEALAAVVR